VSESTDAASIIERSRSLGCLTPVFSFFP